jgi:hypothetical protein
MRLIVVKGDWNYLTAERKRETSRISRGEERNRDHDQNKQETAQQSVGDTDR